jgi:hypothetical protein
MIDALILDFEQHDSGIHFLATHPVFGRRVDVLPLYELERAELFSYRALLIGLHADQRYLATRRGQIEAFLAAERVVVFCGQVAYPILAELGRFRPIPDYRLADLVVERVVEHPIWDGVAVEDLTRRRGVAGFYGRGSNPPPADATVIHTLGPGRHPVDFVCRPSVGGWLLVHAGNDLWNYAPEGTTASRIAPQLLDWAVSVTEGSR